MSSTTSPDILGGCRSSPGMTESQLGAQATSLNLETFSLGAANSEKGS